MNQLIWKQWCESRRLLAILLVWMVLGACYAIAYEMGMQYRAAVGHLMTLTTFFYIYIAAIVLAMRVSHGERTDRTLGFSMSLPVSRQRLAGVRLGAAVVTLAAPIVVAACLLSIAFASGLIEQAAPPRTDSYIQLINRDAAALATTFEQLWSVAAIAILAGVMHLNVLSLAGTYLRSQAQVGLLGAVLAVAFSITGATLWPEEGNDYSQFIFGAFLPQSLVAPWGYTDGQGSYTDHELARFRWPALCVAILLQWLLFRYFMARYGSPVKPATANARQRRWGLPPILAWLPLRFRSRWLAMIWLEARQSAPLVIAGLMFAFLIAIAAHQSLPDTMWYTALFWTVVVGSSLYGAELEPRLAGFWRSRPISPGAWFWTKFIIGLVTVIGVLDGTTIYISWDAPRFEMMGMSRSYVACIPILHSLMYTLAVFGTCLFRKPVIGGIVAILAFALLFMTLTSFPAAMHLDPMNVHNNLLAAERGLTGPGVATGFDLSAHPYPLVYGALVTAIVLLSICSSRLARPLEQKFRWIARGA